MKFLPRSLLALLALLPAALFAHDQAAGPAKNCGCACCQGKEVCCCQAGKTARPDEAKRYPLKGVVVDVRAAQSALLVKHEDITGLMPAMTMLFQVDAATLKAAVKGQAITATLVQRGEQYWLENLKPVPAR